MAEGISRDEIANRVGDRGLPSSYMNSRSMLGRHCARARSEGSIAAGSPTFCQLRDNDATQRQEKTTDIPLSSPAIGMLALEAMSRDLDIAEFIGQVLVAAMNKDVIQKILR